MPYRKKGSPKGKWKTQWTKYTGAGNPNYKGPNTECHYCHKPIRKSPSHARKAAHAYCSHKCYSLDRVDPNSWAQQHKPKIKMEDMRGENHPRWNGIKKFCKMCEKELVGRDQRTRGYCSDKCVKKYERVVAPVQRAIRAEAMRDTFQKNQDVICVQCKGIFHRRSGKRARFCSRVCQGQWTSENKSRENSPLWKGGTGSYNDYPTSFNAKFRYSIRKRDNFTCQHCKVVIRGKWRKGKWLDVHHIDQNKQNGDPDNLISLCRKCHRQEHIRLSHDSMPLQSAPS